MPKINLTDAEVRKVALGNTAWYSEARPNKHRGLRLWRQPVSQDLVRVEARPEHGQGLSIKLGRYPAMSSTLAWERCQEQASRIANGQPEAEKMPTFRVMLDRYCDEQIADGALSHITAKDYRDCARLHLAQWLDLPLDQIKSISINDHLRALRASKPSTANKASVVVGAVYQRAQGHDYDVKSPVRLFKRAAMKQREVDTSIAWAQRLQEIEGVDHLVKRTAWLLLWHTGIRSGNLRGLTWADVDLDAKVVRLAKMKNGLARTLPLSDTSVRLFKRLVGLHPRLVFPGRGGAQIDHLDRLPSMSQHHLRHLWADAAAACHLPSYIIAFLKGDVVKADGQDMVAHYMHGRRH